MHHLAAGRAISSSSCRAADECSPAYVTHAQDLADASQDTACDVLYVVGGLYGIALGRMFYGESMFSWRSDASKIAVAHLARYLERLGFGMVDCQMHTAHLASLGAREIPRDDFIARLDALVAAGPAPGPWPAADASHLWHSAA